MVPVKPCHPQLVLVVVLVVRVSMAGVVLPREVLDGTGLTPMTDGESDLGCPRCRRAPRRYRCREPGEPYTEFTRLACYAKVVGSGARVKVAELVDFEALQGEKIQF